jgi:uncharacterized protein (TIGR00251 family)
LALWHWGTLTLVNLIETAGAVQFSVRVIPRAGRTGVAGIRAGALLVRLAAPPVEGAANAALVELVADLVGRPKRDVSIVSGHRARVKRVRIEGLSARDLESKLSGILPA